MNYAGVDLHKHSLTVCVLDQDRRVIRREKLLTHDEAAIEDFFRSLGPVTVALEATGGSTWFVDLIEPIAARLIVAHPKALRSLVSRRRKSDRLDAKLIAELAVLELLPEVRRVSAELREHRMLVRYRNKLREDRGTLQVQIRRILSEHNADVPWLFTERGRAYLAKYELRAAERVVVDDLLGRWDELNERLAKIEAAIRDFAARQDAKWMRWRGQLRSIPGVGFVTSEVVLSELGDVGRFRSAKRVASSAGLAPACHESGGKRKDLSIDKEGSRHLRWVLIEAAWGLVRCDHHWRGVYEKLKARMKAKKAIVAVARRLLTVMYSLLKHDRFYQPEPAAA